MKIIFILLSIFLITCIGYTQTIIKITAPEKDAKIEKDSIYQIKWTYNTISVSQNAKFRIELISGNKVITIADSTSQSTGYEFKFSVDTGKYFLRISDASNFAITAMSDLFEVHLKTLELPATENAKKNDSNYTLVNTIDWIKKHFPRKNDFKNNLIVMDTILAAIDKIKDDKSEGSYYKRRYLLDIKEDLDDSIKDRTRSQVNDFPIKISVIGDAALVGSSNDSKQDKFNTKGSLGFKFITHVFKKVAVHGKVSLILLSNTDTIKSTNKISNINNGDTSYVISNPQDFGNSILNPRSGESIQSGMVELDFYIKKWWGINTSIVLGTKVWKDSINENSINTENARILGISAGIFWAPFNRTTKENNELSLKLHFSITNRFLLGDAKINSDFRYRVLNKDRYQFWGIEPGFILDFKSITAFVSCPIFFGQSVKGVTSGQFLGGISLSTSIIEFEP